MRGRPASTSRVLLPPTVCPLHPTPPPSLCPSAGRLTWLVYIIGAVIGGRVSFASTDEQDAMDGELVCRYVMITTLTDQLSFFVIEWHASMRQTVEKLTSSVQYAANI